ncbi:MAG: hypothetical protein WA628_11035 [Terriglobales bacterium]
MAELQEFAKILLGFLGVLTCLWLYLKLLAFFKERGVTLGRYDASREPAKVEIQTLFHGNTKDEDQI